MKFFAAIVILANLIAWVLQATDLLSVTNFTEAVTPLIWITLHSAFIVALLFSEFFD